MNWTVQKSSILIYLVDFITIFYLIGLIGFISKASSRIRFLWILSRIFSNFSIWSGLGGSRSTSSLVENRRWFNCSSKSLLATEYFHKTHPKKHAKNAIPNANIGTVKSDRWKFVIWKKKCSKNKKFDRISHYIGAAASKNVSKCLAFPGMNVCFEEKYILIW